MIDVPADWQTWHHTEYGTDTDLEPDPHDDWNNWKGTSTSPAVAFHAGLDDEGRHEFIDAFTGGRTRSGKDILPEEMADLMAQLVRYKRGEIRIHRPEGEPSQLVRVETTDTSDKADTDRDPELWTDTEWHTAIQAAGLKQPAVLRFARRAAQDGGIDAPGTLGEITSPFLATRVRDWIDQNARETP